MRTIWQALIWREWHEHKWKLAALTAILLTVQIYLGVSLGSSDIPPAALWFACLLPGAVFVAIRTATAERSSRTLEFTRALPIQTWQAPAVKLGMAAGACLAPILISALTALGCHLWNHHGDLGSLLPTALLTDGVELRDAYVFGLLAAGMVLSVLFWATAAAAGQPDELHASAASTVVLIGWIIVSAFAALMHDRWELGITKLLAESVIAVGPGGLLLLQQDHVHPWLILLLQMASLACLAAWTVHRFSASYGENSGSTSAIAASPTDGSSAIARSMRRPLVALAWKQWRESVPLCLAGVALAAGFALTSIAVTNEHLFSEHGATMFRMMVLWTGIVTAMVVAIGSFAPDLQPGVWGFWRSRPISLGAWFLMKYLSGAAAVVLFLDGPLIAFDLFCISNPLRSMPTDVLLSVSLPLHLLSYTVAVCSSCWMRQGVYAGIVSLTAMVGLLTAPEGRTSLAWLNLARTLEAGGRSGFALASWIVDVYLPFAASNCALILFVLALAWSAVRFNLGAHSLASAAGRLRTSPH